MPALAYAVSPSLPMDLILLVTENALANALADVKARLLDHASGMPIMHLTAV